MNRLRSTWAKRWVAALLLGSLLPVTFAAAAQTAQHTASLADWIRAQLRNPDDEAVERALEAAQAAHPRSLESFLRVFIDALEAQQPGTQAARAFAAPGLSDDALIAYLQGRYHGLASDAVLPRTALLAAHAPPGLTPDRGAAALAVLPARGPAQQAHAAAVPGAARPVFVLPVRARSAAQPLGP